MQSSEKKRIFLDSIGCRLNQSEIETIGRKFRSQGHELVSDPALADLAIINTCLVTSKAAADSRKMIRGAAKAGASEVLPIGCWVTLSPNEALKLKGVSRIVTNQDKANLVPNILGHEIESFDIEPVAREPLPGARLRTRAFIKIQDGCDNRCTFCITTLARGSGISTSIEHVLQDVHLAVQGGVQEVVLSGVHLGSWGHDLSPKLSLPVLIRAILNHTDITRVRLSSLEPWDLDPDFFQLWQDEPRLCRQLHLPLQSGCDRTLRRMARKTTQGSFSALVSAARQVDPLFAITTDLIAGFPGETPDEFDETMAFVKSMKFAGGHVFTYSERTGTAAAQMPNQVPHNIRKERNAQLRALLERSAAVYQSQFIGETLSVLWESATGLDQQGWKMTGLTDNYLRVNAYAPQNLWNQIIPVKINRRTRSGLFGEIIYAEDSHPIGGIL